MISLVYQFKRYSKDTFARADLVLFIPIPDIQRHNDVFIQKLWLVVKKLCVSAWGKYVERVVLSSAAGPETAHWSCWQSLIHSHSKQATSWLTNSYWSDLSRLVYHPLVSSHLPPRGMELLTHLTHWFRKIIFWICLWWRKISCNPL